MAQEIENILSSRLEERRIQGNFRALRNANLKYDFVSNDYLGLARSTALFDCIQDEILKLDHKFNGSSGSRLLSGNHQITEDLESELADLFHAEAVLLFNSGYNANLALISSVAQKGDTILYDELSHICIKEGAWLSQATTIKFKHNDCSDLERKLRDANGNKFIATESLFSMDGDFAHIEELITIAEKYDANIIVDEAHSTGCYGEGGNGWLCQKHLEQKIFARVYTFGKAMGVHGACVAGTQMLKDYLINFGRPFIYTTALPLHSIISIQKAFHHLKSHPQMMLQLQQKVALFSKNLKEKLNYKASDSAIQPIVIPGNDVITGIAQSLQRSGFDVRPILTPTVKAGTERLRISLHTFNTDTEIETLIDSLSELL